MRHETRSIGKLIAAQIVMDPSRDNTSGNKLMQAVIGTILYSVADPFTVSLGYVPSGARLIEAKVQIEAAFDAGTTNVLVVGTSGNDDAYVAAGDVDESSTGLTTLPLNHTALTARTQILAKYTQTGTAATAGKAHVCIVFVI